MAGWVIKAHVGRYKAPHCLHWFRSGCDALLIASLAKVSPAGVRNLLQGFLCVTTSKRLGEDLNELLQGVQVQEELERKAIKSETPPQMLNAAIPPGHCLPQVPLHGLLLTCLSSEHYPKICPLLNHHQCHQTRPEILKWPWPRQELMATTKGTNIIAATEISVAFPKADTLGWSYIKW